MLRSPGAGRTVSQCSHDLGTGAVGGRVRTVYGPRPGRSGADPLNRPGAQLLWHGYTQLTATTFAFELRDEYG